MRSWCLMVVLACGAPVFCCDPLAAGISAGGEKPQGRAIAVTDANFRAEVEQAEELVLIEFWADWCGPCQMLEPVLQRLAADYAGRAKIALVNVTDESDNPQLARRFDPEPLPCLVLLRNGREIDRRTGAGANAEAASANLRRWLDRHLGK